MLTLVELFYAAQVAAFSYTLYLLFEDGQIFAAWGRLLIRKRLEWPNLTKILGLCHRCLTGQMAAWGGLLLLDVSLLKLPMFTASAILFSEILNKLISDRH